MIENKFYNTSGDILFLKDVFWITFKKWDDSERITVRSTDKIIRLITVFPWPYGRTNKLYKVIEFISYI